MLFLSNEFRGLMDVVPSTDNSVAWLVFGAITIARIALEFYKHKNPKDGAN